VHNNSSSNQQCKISKKDSRSGAYAFLIHPRNQWTRLCQQISQMQVTFYHGPQQWVHSHTMTPSELVPTWQREISMSKIITINLSQPTRTWTQRKACFLSEPCEYERRRHKLYHEESYPAAPKPNKSNQTSKHSYPSKPENIRSHHLGLLNSHDETTFGQIIRYLTANILIHRIKMNTLRRRLHN
jgi:hypothetical protein